jgi:hypothetical protein
MDAVKFPTPMMASGGQERRKVMPPIAGSYPDTVDDWEGLLTSARNNADKLPDISRHTTPLELVLGQTKEMKALQKSHTAARQEASQQLKKLLAQGRELAIRLRAVVRGEIGPTSERLVQFKVKPIRKRAPRKTAEKPPEVTTPATPPAGPQPSNQQGSEK